MRFSIVVGMLNIGYVELFPENKFLLVDLERVFHLLDDLKVCRQFLALEQPSISLSQLCKIKEKVGTNLSDEPLDRSVDISFAISFVDNIFGALV
jgi:hypothetical protein